VSGGGPPPGRDLLFSGASAGFAADTTARLRSLTEYRRARTVLATLSFGTEWDTRPFALAVLADGKRLVLPRVVRSPRSLSLHAVSNLSADLVPGVWGIEEPEPARCAGVALADVDLALVPALACDAAGNRLGYGAGHFDRLLSGAGPYSIDSKISATLAMAIRASGGDALPSSVAW